MLRATARCLHFRTFNERCQHIWQGRSEEFAFSSGASRTTLRCSTRETSSLDRIQGQRDHRLRNLVVGTFWRSSFKAFFSSPATDSYTLQAPRCTKLLNFFMLSSWPSARFESYCVKPCLALPRMALVILACAVTSFLRSASLKRLTVLGGDCRPPLQPTCSRHLAFSSSRVERLKGVKADASSRAITHSGVLRAASAILDT